MLQLRRLSTIVVQSSFLIRFSISVACSLACCGDDGRRTTDDPTLHCHYKSQVARKRQASKQVTTSEQITKAKILVPTTKLSNVVECIIYDDTRTSLQ